MPDLTTIEELLKSEIFTGIFEWVYKKSYSIINRINEKQKLIDIRRIDKEDYLHFIESIFAENYKWASNISFRETSKIKKTDNIFVITDIYITPKKSQINNNGKKISFTHLFDNFNESIVLYGEPGSGKTTSIKKVFLDYYSQKNPSLSKFGFVLIIRLKEIDIYSKDKSEILILNKLFSFFNISYFFDDKTNILNINKIETLYYIITDFIESAKMLLVFDGFDEINDEEVKGSLIKVLNRFSMRLRKSKYILTCRSDAFNFYIENTNEYEIANLTDSQIFEFINNWFDNKYHAQELYTELIDASFFDTSRRPLNLAHLCAIYERDRSIPSKPKTVYKKIINLLLEEWDGQRQINRKSKYSGFKTDRKVDFLSRFAYELTVVCKAQVFNKDLIGIIYDVICEDFELPKKEALNVINEIISHSGLIRQASYDQFEFSHKSLQEYFVANYIIRLPRITNDSQLLLSIPNELAIVVTLSSTPELLTFNIINDILKTRIFDNNFISEFLNRLEIEKPDFRPNILLPITLLFILDLTINILFPVHKSINQKNITEDIKKDNGLKKIQTIEKVYNKILKLIINQPKNRLNRIKKTYTESKIQTVRYDVLQKRTIKNNWIELRCHNKKVRINSLDINLPNKILITNYVAKIIA